MHLESTMHQTENSTLVPISNDGTAYRSQECSISQKQSIPAPDVIANRYMAPNPNLVVRHGDIHGQSLERGYASAPPQLSHGMITNNDMRYGLIIVQEFGGNRVRGTASLPA